MEEFRSKSCGDGRRIEVQAAAAAESSNIDAPKPNTLQDLRCYSASYAQTTTTDHSTQQIPNKQVVQLKKGKSTGSLTKNWSLNDPELQRKKRVASYKVYTVEGKVKGSFRKSFRWLKDRYTHMVYGVR